MEILKDRPLSILLTGEEGKELLQLQAEYLELKQNELSVSLNILQWPTTSLTFNQEFKRSKRRR